MLNKCSKPCITRTWRYLAQYPPPCRLRSKWNGPPCPKAWNDHPWPAQCTHRDGEPCPTQWTLLCHGPWEIRVKITSKYGEVKGLAHSTICRSLDCHSSVSFHPFTFKVDSTSISSLWRIQIRSVIWPTCVCWTICVGLSWPKICWALRSFCSAYFCPSNFCSSLWVLKSFCSAFFCPSSFCSDSF